MIFVKVSRVFAQVEGVSGSSVSRNRAGAVEGPLQMTEMRTRGWRGWGSGGRQTGERYLRNLSAGLALSRAGSLPQV